MKILVLRHVRLYLRDRSAVFFSMLSVVIVIALYALFLADSMLSDELQALPDAREILNLWLTGGLLSIVAVTTTLASYSIMVRDRTRHIIKDFYASSISRSKLVLSYIIAASLTGFIMSMFTLVVAQGYILIDGGSLIAIKTLVPVIGLSILCVAAGSSMMFFLSQLLHSESAFSNASTMIGTMIGFIMGIYMPIGVLPGFAQTIIRLFPISHGCASFRRLLTDDLLRDAVSNAPTGILEKLQEQLGIVLVINDTPISIATSCVILVVTSLVFLSLSIVLFRRQARIV